MKAHVSLAALTAAIGSLAAGVPAAAQTTMTAPPAGTDNGGLIYVWVWILVIGVICIVGGASLGNMGGKR